MDPLIQNSAWILVSTSNAQKTVPTKGIFKCKEALDRNSNKFEKYKAQLATRSLEQVDGIYNKTFAPPVKFVTLRLIPAIVAVEDLELQKVDVKTVFLNGDF